MKCHCGHEFTPSPELYQGTQFYPSTPEQGDVYLVLLLFNCPRVKADGERCASTRCVVMFDATGDEDQHLEPIAAE